MNCGQERIRTSEVERQRIYSPPHLAALEPALFLSHLSDSNQRPADYKSAALPTELKWQKRVKINPTKNFTSMHTNAPPFLGRQR
jgi:hypothetical protein